MIVCPRCEGQRYDRGSCGLCGNVGWLDDNGEQLAASGASARPERSEGALPESPEDLKAGRGADVP